ncbi:MerR family transcriptional regulator [Enterococcus crotali]|uniref:MerR family transcriptional regulator n=1 Tax=Enterococcus crotali TaxID=1453587 RepID=UPI00046FCD16|nr:MerR family transcriptional regulator [Enterococcus crotali]
MTGKTVQQAAAILNIPKSTLRYYDKVDLLKPTRKENGYRIYKELDLIMIKYIVVMKYGEFNLEETQLVLKMIGTETTASCREKTELLIESKKKVFQAKIDYYKQMLSLFEKIPEINDLNLEKENEIDRYIEEIYHMISENGTINE